MYKHTEKRIVSFVRRRIRQVISITRCFNRRRYDFNLNSQHIVN